MNTFAETTRTTRASILQLTAYTRQTCIDACTSFSQQNATDVHSSGATLGEDLQHRAVVNNGANCWLQTEVDEGGHWGMQDAEESIPTLIFLSYEYREKKAHQAHAQLVVGVHPLTMFPYLVTTSSLISTHKSFC